MVVYESETLSREELEKKRKQNVCAVCGGWLNMFLDPETHTAFIACNDWHRTHHEGIARAYKEPGELNIPTRRKEMEDQYGKKTSTALAKLPTSGALTQPQAMHILKLVFPQAPEDEIIRCAILCRDFGLHPLMKEVYLIPFKDGKSGKETWATVIGIAANRKMAADKKGAYSFIDDTPRAATQEEITKQYGKDSEEERDNLISICKVKGEKGNEAVGFGLWPKDKSPYGTDKGNTKRNMANIRAERQCLDRLPGEALPQGVEVIDEAYAEVPDVGKIRTETGEVIEPEVIEPETFEAPAPEESEDEPTSWIDIDWLKESVKELQSRNIKAYSNASLLSYMKSIYKVEGEDIYEIASKLNKGKAKHLANFIQDALNKPMKS